MDMYQGMDIEIFEDDPFYMEDACVSDDSDWLDESYDDDGQPTDIEEQEYFAQDGEFENLISDGEGFWTNMSEDW